MAKLVFRLRNVPDDEAEDVRTLLSDNDIEYFETSPGNWGISMPAIWVHKDEDFAPARQLIDHYQVQRADRMRQEYELIRQRGELRTMWHSFIENQLRFIGYMALIAVVLYLSLRFFLSF